jgi:hypothetical protein
VKHPTAAAKRAGIGLLLLIVSALTGCDNVNWGGVDVAVVPPPPSTGGRATRQEATAAAAESLPQGPILYYVARAGTGAVLTPVAELSGDSLLPVRGQADPRVYANRFVAENLRQGAEFDLFTRGARVGTFVVQSARVPEQDLCPLLPMATGTLELGVAADSVREFLAIAKPHSPSVGARTANAPETAGRMRFVAPILAERILRGRQAELPGNWQAAMEQVYAFPASGRADAGFSATFLVGDEFGTGNDDAGYSLFFLAVPTASQTGWDTVHVDYRNYAQTKKAAPRVIDYLDWTRDDQVELLLQVFGTRDTWFEAVSRDAEGRWRRVLVDRCEQGGRPTLLPSVPPPIAPPTGDTVQ